MLIALEHFGGYALIEKIEDRDEGAFALHSSGYYAQNYDDNPYRRFSIQHLHPFYMFSLPWTEEAITAVNNEVASLEPNGFRVSISNDAERQAVVLGGSTAFGVYATDDDATLVSVLNKSQSGHNFHNRGVPSWNSHQELVSFTKLPFNAEFVIALWEPRILRVSCGDP